MTAPRFHIVTNPFLRDGALDADLGRALATLLAAARTAPDQARITLMVDAADALFFEDTASGDPLVDVRILRTGDRLPMLADILAGLNGTESEVAVYLNADINVPPFFLDLLARNLVTDADQVIRALIINRKDMIAGDPMRPFNDPQAVFRGHNGYDCFAFPTAILTQLALGEVRIGLPPIGTHLALNLAALCPQVKLLNDALITWHEGDGKASSWRDPTHEAARKTNVAASYAALDTLFAAHPLPADFAIPHLKMAESYLRNYRTNRSTSLKEQS